MTNKTFPLIAVALLLLSACNRIDSAFVEQLQSGLNKAQENRAAFEASQQNFSAVIDKLEKLPDGCKNDPKYSYADVYSQAIQLEQGCASMIVQQDDMMAKVEAALNEYTDGKITKEAAEQEVTGLLANFDGYQQRIETMNRLVADLNKTSDDILTKWQSASDAEKAASAAMPPPVLPDIAAARSAAGAIMSNQQDPARANTGNTPTTQPGALVPATQPQGQGGTLTPATPGTLVAPKQDGGKQ